MNSSKSILHIDTNIIKENYDALCKASKAEVGASVKANAYGLGVKCIAPILEKSGCRYFFVSSCDEGVELRSLLGAKANIYVFNGVFKNELKIFLEHDLIPVLNHLQQVEIWHNCAIELTKKLPCIIHIDTGMHRLGMDTTDFKCLSNNISNYQLNILYVMSHLSSSEDTDNLSNHKQLTRFQQYTKGFPGVKRSLANSSGIFLGKDYHFDLVRPGAAIYGINSELYPKNSGIKNAINLHTPIIQIHNLEPNESLGYNETYINQGKKSCLIATIPIGYADGFSRALSNKGEVYINGFKAPIVGRVSMDLITIDVSHIPSKEIFLGAQVEVIGDNCTLGKLASLSETNSYEIITMLGDRYKRIYS